MRRILIPAPYVGQSDAILAVDSTDGETAVMSLELEGAIVARGGEFRRPAFGAHTWHDAPAREVAGTFGAFLAHALESGEEGARDGWDVLTEAAEDWTDALAMLEWEAEEDGAPALLELEELEMPYSEVCMSMRVAGSRMLVAPLPHGMAQLFTLAGRRFSANGRRFSAPITRGEAGLPYDVPSSREGS